MNLSEFINLVRKEKKVFAVAFVVLFPLMLIFTLTLNSIPYEITATVRIDSNALLSAATQPNVEKTYNKVVLSSDKLSDRDAMEYVQNNKEFYSQQGLVDYTVLVSRFADKGFINKTVNSVEFHNYLIEKGILESKTSVSMVEQTDTMSLRISGKNKDSIESGYVQLLKSIPQYVNDTIKSKLLQVASALDSAILNDREEADKVIAEYEQLKAKTEFAKTADYNNALELLNKLSALSHDANQNMSVLNRINSLAANDLSPDMVIKNQNFSGLNLASTIVPYVIIEVIASLLLALLFVFLKQALKNATIDKITD